MEILTLTTLYPNHLNPRHGVFVKNRLDALDQIEGITRKIIAPIPKNSFFSLFSDRFKKYDEIDLYETQNGIDVYHPKYFTLPGIKIFNNVTSIAKISLKTILDIYPSGSSFDIVDGQYLYPDGVAAYKVAQAHNKPLILTARGSDVNYWMAIPKVRKQILQSIAYASKVICVSEALKKSLMSYGVSEEKLAVIINGVNYDFFNPDIKPIDLRNDYFLSVGNLIPLKGHDIALKALSKQNDAHLIIIGTGPEKQNLKTLANKLNIEDRVRFIDHIDQQKLAEYYAGAKATILMSLMEGMPNVVLESLSTGTPIIGTSAGGIPEVVNSSNGIVLGHRTADELKCAISELHSFRKTRHEISATVNDYRWSTVAREQYKIYCTALHS